MHLHVELLVGSILVRGNGVSIPAGSNHRDKLSISIVEEKEGCLGEDTITLVNSTWGCQKTRFKWLLLAVS